jgi:hypothetical protein
MTVGIWTPTEGKFFIKHSKQGLRWIGDVYCTILAAWNTGWKSCLRVMLLIKNLPQEDEITSGGE